MWRGSFDRRSLAVLVDSGQMTSRKDTERLANIVQSGLEHMALQRTLREMIEKLNLEQEARETMKRALIRAFA